MKREDIVELGRISPTALCSYLSSKSIPVIFPHDTIVGEAAKINGEPFVQPGIVPISLADLSAMTVDFADLPLLNEELQRIFDLHADKSRGRRNERGALVNNLWGTLNPENFVVLYMLAAHLMHGKMLYNERLRCLFIGTGSGYPEVALVRLADSLGVFIDIKTVDKGNLETLIPLDARNAAYGPEQVDGGIGCLIREAAPDIQSRIELVEADSNTDTSIFGFGGWDLVVVDGNHMYDAVYIDLLNSWSALAPGGVMFLDDFGGTKLATNGGVTMAAYQFAAKKRIFGYFVSSPADPFNTNSAFFVRDQLFEATQMTAQMQMALKTAEAQI